MFDNCQWDASRPFVCRAAYRGVIGSINFTLLTSAQQMLRQEQALNPQVGGIDAYNDFLSSLAAGVEEERTQEEQGLPFKLAPRELGGRLKVIREHLDDVLHEHASEVILPLSGKRVKNPWEIGDTIANSLERLIARTPRDLTARMKLEAKAFGKSEEVLLEALKRQQGNNAAYLVANRALILDIIENMTFADPTDLTVEATWEQLPAIVRLRLYAAADNGLYFASDREFQNYVLRNNQASKSNVGIIDGERRELRKEINAFINDAKVKRELAEAHAGGMVMPVLQPVPPAAEETAKAA